MNNILEDLERFITEEDPIAADLENVGDAPVEEESTIKIEFIDLKDDIQKKIQDLILKNMNATDEMSRNNLIKTLNNTPIFDGSVKDFRSQLGIENI